MEQPVQTTTPETQIITTNQMQQIHDKKFEDMLASLADSLYKDNQREFYGTDMTTGVDFIDAGWRLMAFFNVLYLETYDEVVTVSRASLAISTFRMMHSMDDEQWQRLIRRPPAGLTP